jgi:homoserine O-acetyltransferase
MRALEWAISAPERLERLVLIATTPVCRSEIVDLHNAQVSAIELDPAFAGGDYYYNQSPPLQGLALARSIAQGTYGCAPESDAVLSSSLSSSTLVPPDEDAHSFARSFDANSYRVLTRAMNSHDIGRGRGGIESALRQIDIPATVVSILSDRLFPPSDQKLIANYLGNASFVSFDSARGHDGFLHDQPSLDPLLRRALIG